MNTTLIPFNTTMRASVLTLLHEDGHQWAILGWFPKTLILGVAFELSNSLLFLQLVRHLKLQNPPECATLPRLARFV